MADSDDSFYKKMIGLGWLKKSFWIHGKADMDAIKASIEYENNKHIDAIAHRRTDREGLSNNTKQAKAK